MTSPIQAATPASSSRQGPRVSLTPLGSSPPGRYSKKRSRSVYENADEATISAAANRILERFDRKVQEMQDEERLGRERLHERILDERTERQHFEKRWEDEFARTRKDDQTEKERFALGLTEKISRDRKEDQTEQKRLATAMAEYETRSTTLQGQLQGQSEHIESRLDGQASRLSNLHAQFDGQRARNNIFGTRIEDHKRQLDDLMQRVDEIDRREKVNQDIANTRLHRLEAAISSAGRVANQQLPAESRYSGATRPQVREVRPRETLDLGMRGRPAKAVIPDTLIRSDHGKPFPRTLPPIPERNYACSSTSSSRPAQPATQTGSDAHSARPHEGALSHSRSVPKEA